MSAVWAREAESLAIDWIPVSVDVHTDANRATMIRTDRTGKTGI
jgi:hypothetical protein